MRKGNFRQSLQKISSPKQYAIKIYNSLEKRMYIIFGNTFFFDFC